MTAAISIRQLIKVTPSVLAAAGIAVYMNGVFLTENTNCPANKALSFTDEGTVGEYFGSASDEYLAAVRYFAGFTIATKTPSTIYFYRYAPSAIAAFLRSGSFGGMTVSAIQTGGTLTVTVDGVEKTASVNLAEVTSFAEAATVIATALGVTCTYNTQQYAFEIASSTTGADSSVSFASGDMATTLKLTSDESAVQSVGVNSQTPAVAMESLLELTRNWSTFTTIGEYTTEIQMAFATWNGGQSYRFLYVPHTTDGQAIVNGATDTLGQQLAESDAPSGSLPVYGTYLYSAAVMGMVASIDFDRLNGRTNLQYRVQTGLAAYVTSTSQAANLTTNGFTFYGKHSADTDNTYTFFRNGTVSGDFEWMDTYVNQIWLNANLELDMLTLLMSVGSLPYNEDGKTLVHTSVQSTLDAALKFGAIRTGITIDSTQKAAILNAVGIDLTNTLFSKGYYLYIDDATAAVREARGTFPMSLYYTDGGSVQEMNLASIAVL